MGLCNSPFFSAISGIGFAGSGCCGWKKRQKAGKKIQIQE